MKNCLSADGTNARQWLACLQENGYRITEPRRAVVETIATSQQALNPFDVFERARACYPKLGLVTVYRTIEKLEELGLIQRVHQPSGCQAFITAFSGHQHLLICQSCGRVEFFNGDVEQMDGLMQAVGANSGFKIQDHWLQLFGVCATCQQANSTDSN
jgi:Fur family ferric uptake transcriptional regulator